MAIAECSLAELMKDPLVGLVMKSDGVDRCELELLFERVGRGRTWTDRHRGPTDSAIWPRAELVPCSPS